MLADLLRKLTSLTRSGGLPIVRVGARVWYLSSAGVELFGDGGPDLDGWLVRGAAVVVKSNPARTVYRVTLPGATVFVKHCKISGLRALGQTAVQDLARTSAATTEPELTLEFPNVDIPPGIHNLVVDLVVTSAKDSAPIIRDVRVA